MDLRQRMNSGAAHVGLITEGRPGRESSEPVDVEAWREAQPAPRRGAERATRTKASPRLVVVSNRLPTTGKHAGGLVNALLPALRERGGMWCGWSGATVAAPTLHERDDGPISVLELDLDPAAVAGYYRGYSNMTLWPRLHGMDSRSRFQEQDYAAYRDVNRRFAAALSGRLRGDDVVWVHDYHLIPLAEELRAAGWTGPVGYFHHLPVPSRAGWLRIPHGDELGAALMQYSHISVQTPEDAERLAAILGDGPPPPIEAHPARIDSHAFRELAVSAPLPLDEDVIAGRTLLFGVDRLDYTKGIALRLEAWERVLEHRPDLRESAVFVQWAAPSREDIDEYREERAAIEAVARRIDKRYGHGRRPLILDISDHPRSEVAAALQRSDIGVVTSVADGMNLVAKEFAAVHGADNPGALILSQGCGAAITTLSNAIIVQGNSVASIAGAMERAIDMGVEERRRQARVLRSAVDAESRTDWASKVARRIEAAGSGLWAAPASHRRDHPVTPTTIPQRVRIATAEELAVALEERLQDWASEQLLEPVQSATPATHEAAQREGLHACSGVDWLLERRPELRSFALEMRDAGYTRALVIGTGESIATAALFAARSRDEPRGVRLDVVDSAKPEAIARIQGELDAEHTLIVVADRCGSRETLGLLSYLWSRRPEGAQYVAVTEVDSPLHVVARQRGFRAEFLDRRAGHARAVPFSYAGMLPAALAGVDLDLLAAHARSMSAACAEPRASDNPALKIAVLLAYVAEARGAVSVRVDDTLKGLDQWLRTALVGAGGAEPPPGSGLAVLPADPTSSDWHGLDNAFVLVGPRRLDRTHRALEAAEQTVVHCPIADWHGVGAMFVLWGAAVAIAERLCAPPHGVAWQRTGQEG